MRRGVVTMRVCIYKCQSITVTPIGWGHRYDDNYVVNRESPGCTENTRRVTNVQVAKAVPRKEPNAMNKY